MVLPIVDETKGFLCAVSIYRQLDGTALHAIGILNGYLVD